MVADIGLEIVGIVLEEVVVDITPMVVVVHITVFGCIAITKNLIGYNSSIDFKSLTDYASFVTQRVVDEIMIGLAAELFAMKMAVAEGLILETVEIDGDGMHTEIDLIEENIKILL